LRAWIIGTGKTAKPLITVGNIDVTSYEVYQNDINDFTYTRDWQHDSEKSISLLKCEKPLNFYPPEEESILAENQDANFFNYNAQKQGQYFNFKILSMTNSVVKEELSFTFNILTQENKSLEKHEEESDFGGESRIGNQSPTKKEGHLG